MSSSGESPVPESPRAHVVRRGAGLPVVAVHGNGVDHRVLLAADDALASVGGLERCYLDLAGFGLTPALPGVGGLPELADWLVGEVRSIVGEGPFALLANSLGGLLARHIRATLPKQVVGMALIAPVVDPDASRRTLPAFRVVERDDELLRSLDDVDRADFTEMAARQTRGSWALFERHALPGIRAADPDAMARLGERYFLLDDPEVGAASVRGPVLVLTGRQDHVVGYEDQLELVRSHYPDATYAALNGAGHNVHLDRPDASFALLREWAADLTASR